MKKFKSSEREIPVNTGSADSPEKSARENSVGQKRKVVEQSLASKTKGEALIKPKSPNAAEVKSSNPMEVESSGVDGQFIGAEGALGSEVLHEEIKIDSNLPPLPKAKATRGRKPKVEKPESTIESVSQATGTQVAVQAQGTPKLDGTPQIPESKGSSTRARRSQSVELATPVRRSARHSSGKAGDQ